MKFLEKPISFYPFRLSFNLPDIKIKIINSENDIKSFKRYLSSNSELRLKEFTLKNIKFDIVPAKLSVNIYESIAVLINSYDENEDLIDNSDSMQITFCNAASNDSKVDCTLSASDRLKRNRNYDLISLIKKYAYYAKFEFIGITFYINHIIFKSFC